MTQSKVNPFHWIRAIYSKTLNYAEHNKAPYFLSLLAFLESSFFPIPPDVLLLAMGASKPKKSFYYAFLSTVFSVLGGLLGYWIGMTFWDAIQSFAFQHIFTPEQFQIVSDHFNENVFFAIFLAGFTVIPFKVFTITAGVLNVALAPFIGAAILSRGLRFFILGGLLYFFGAEVKKYIEKHFEWAITAITALLLVLLYMLKWSKH